MNPKKLKLRCYAEELDDQWQAFCIDYGLAVQGDTLEEVRTKLFSMIKEYRYDALYGEDKEYADQLLKRRAPFMQMAKYNAYFIIDKINLFRGLFYRTHTLFEAPISLTHQNHAH